jgi:hypothetical protein
MMLNSLHLKRSEGCNLTARKHTSGHLHAEIKITVNSMPNNVLKKGLKQNLEINTQVTRCQNYPLYFSAH